MAVGTTAFAVGVNALVNLAGHWRRGNVKWPCAAVFAAGGLVGSIVGARLGLRMNGQKLLLLFAFIMAAVAWAMLRSRFHNRNAEVRINLTVGARLLGIGAVAGLVSGFFGIGGGLLIVPGLIFAAGMPIINAVGSSLVAVSVFGLTTATTYAMSNLVDWKLATLLVAGGAMGGVIGVRMAMRLGTHQRALEKVFAAVVLVLAVTVAIRAVLELRG